MRGRLAAPAAPRRAAAPAAAAAGGGARRARMAASAKLTAPCAWGGRPAQPPQQPRVAAAPALTAARRRPRRVSARALSGALLGPAAEALAPELYSITAGAAPPPAAAPPAAAPRPAAAPAPAAAAAAASDSDLPPPPPADHPVMELLRARLAEGSKPGARRDGFKFGLVVEGGGMRGIVTGAMLMALLGFDARDAFDAVYGASAGAMNASYFLTGQAEGLDIYTEHLAASDAFLSLKRYWMGGEAPAMDLEYLLDDVMGQIAPLDFHGVINSPVPLKVVASSLDTLRAEILHDFESVDDLKMSLKCSAAVPNFAGPPRAHRGHRFVDAAVFEPIPVKSAVRDGCTHVLALCSRPASSGPAWGKLLRRTLTATVKHIMFSPPYMKDAWRVEHRHRTHQGQPLEDVLTAMAAGRATTTLDLSNEDALIWPSGFTTPPPGGGATSGAPGGSLSRPGSGGRSPVGGVGGGTPLASGEFDNGASGAAAADMAGTRRAEGVRAADGVGGSHIMPIYPSAAASFAPVCTHVPTLLRGRDDGFNAVQRALLPALASAARAR